MGESLPIFRPRSAWRIYGERPVGDHRPGQPGQAESYLTVHNKWAIHSPLRQPVCGAGSWWPDGVDEPRDTEEDRRVRSNGGSRGEEP